MALTVNGFTLAGFGACAVIAWRNPTLFDRLSSKDALGTTGLFEHLTVIVLLPGIVAAGMALLLWRNLFPVRWLGVWLLMWTLACVYFAGEECSWGQWYFAFETPDAFDEFNDQREMNLHNISSWLDQKPRLLVELFIITAGLLVPVIFQVRRSASATCHRFRSSNLPLRGATILPWIVAPSMCWSAALFVLLQRTATLSNRPLMQRLGDSEFRELGIAWFLGLYLLSYAVRLSRRHGSTQTTDDERFMATAAR